MGFRENLIKKIYIKQLTDNVINSIHPTDSAQRINRDAMRQLLEMGTYENQKERDLDLYLLNDNDILVLDNELKIYNTTVEDVGLRKSPTVSEMISIRNAIKILSDKDVVISRKGETVQRIQKELISSLDLTYDEADIQSMVEDGAEALKNKYAEGVVEILTLFAELLGFGKAPKAFRAAHHHIWGKTAKSKSGELLFGPLIIFGLVHNTLKMCQPSFNSADRQSVQRFQLIIKGQRDADFSNAEVLEELKQAVLNRKILNKE